MDKFFAQPEATRAAAIQETAAKMRLHPVPVEKDFWVCYLLCELFALDCVKDHIIFKGGTSLSKAYGVIDRFSEDIDLSIHASAFDVEIPPDFASAEASERRAKIGQLYKVAAKFVDQEFVPELRARLEQSLPEANWRLQPFRRSDDFNIILFHYPKTDQKVSSPHYTTPQVQIEIGVRAEHDPSEQRIVRPYIAEHFPQILGQPDTTVKVLSAKRTFWEKATIYHAESFKPPGQSWPRRYARHAYDLHQLMQSNLGKEALEDLALLKRVAVHKTIFHANAGIDYHLAYTGGLKVVPEGSRLQELEDDYAAMRDFFMAEPPPFEDILESLKIIEQQTNSALS